MKNNLFVILVFIVFCTTTCRFYHSFRNNDLYAKQIKSKIDSIVTGSDILSQKNTVKSSGDTLYLHFYVTDTRPEINMRNLVLDYFIYQISLIREYHFIRFDVTINDTITKDTGSFRTDLFSADGFKGDSTFYAYPALQKFVPYIIKNISTKELILYDRDAGNWYHKKLGNWNDYSFAELIIQFAGYCKTGENRGAIKGMFDFMYNYYSGLGGSQFLKQFSDSPNGGHIKWFLDNCN